MDKEEQAESAKMYSHIDKYNLNGQIRWISAQMNRVRNGELYRYIADTKGVFIQPAFYEAFGLTVVEAMTCGLPTFATVHGGPDEIIIHGVSGFHIDPYQGDKVSELLVNFYEKCLVDPTHWDTISGGGLNRIYEKYTWKLYSERLMTLSGVYGFWKYVWNLDRRETRRYLEMFYALKYRNLAKAVPLAVDGVSPSLSPSPSLGSVVEVVAPAVVASAVSSVNGGMTKLAAINGAKVDLNGAAVTTLNGSGR